MKYCGKSKSVHMYLVSVLHTLFNAKEARWREGKTKSRRYSQSPAPINKKFQSRSTWVNRKISKNSSKIQKMPSP